MTSLETKADRLLQIETLLLDHRDGLTIPEIAERLGVHRSTVWRYQDAGSLARRGMRMDEDGRLKLDRKAYQVQVRFNLHEAMAIHLAIRLLATRLDRRNPHAASAVRKLGQSLAGSSPAISRHLQRSADGMDGPEQWTDVHYTQALECLTEAWAASRRVHLWYFSERAGAVKEYTFSPYFLEPYAVGQSTYVIGLWEEGQKLRTFKVERIEKAELLAEGYTIPEDFDPAAQLADAWGIWGSAKEPVEVVLRFSPRVSRRVQESRWHRSQEVEAQPDGWLIWRARVAEPREMMPWIKGWGAEVEVLQPEEMRRAMAAEAARLSALYQN